MRLGSHPLVFSAALAVALLAFTPRAHADPIGYQYTFSGASPLNYAPVPSITGSFTVSASLAGLKDYNATYSTTMPVAIGGGINLIDFSFSDGTTTFTKLNSYVTGVDLQTNASGGISYYLIEFDSQSDLGGEGPLLNLSNEDGPYGSFGREPTVLQDGTVYYDSYDSFSGPVPVLTPEPSSWALLGTGALGLLGLAWYTDRRRKAAPAIP